LNDLNQKFPHIKVRLFAKDNPFAILGRTIEAMRDAGVGQDRHLHQASDERRRL